MSGRVITQFILVCDGCETEMPPHASATEARAAAYGDGWRFPSQVTSKGKTAGRASDVCPNCIDGWTPQLSKMSQWTDERRAEHAEVMHTYAERRRRERE